MSYGSYNSSGSGFLSSFSGAATIVLALLLTYAYWRIFVKAGEAGWKSLIPGYSYYLLYRIADRTHLFWYNLGLAAIGLLAFLFFFESSPVFFAIIIIGLAITAFVFHIKFCNGLAHAFGRSSGFAVGLLFLQTIFIMILAFSDCEHYTQE